MILRHLAVLLAAWPGAGRGVLAKQEPTIYSQTFEKQPQQLSFFDDSETALALVLTGKASAVWVTTGAGDKWEKAAAMPEGDPYSIYMHPTDNSVAVVLGRRRKHWITYDKAKTWSVFETKEDPSPDVAIRFHAADSKKIIFQDFEDCDIFTFSCLGKSYYTTDGFKTTKLLINGRKDCNWAKSTERFTTGSEDLDKDRIVCVAKGKYSSAREDQRLLIMDDYSFEHATEPKIGGRIVYGMGNIATVKGYMVAAARPANSREEALYVTDDTKTWHRAEFGGHRIEEDAYTVLESTNYSIQVDVRNSHNADIGVLFGSNSNGTYFSRLIEHTNRNRAGLVDFEKITDIQGIILVNTVSNAQEVENKAAAKVKVSQISFDDGRTFESLTVKDARLHLHSVTEQKQDGKVFTSNAPGMVLGVGNTGESLGKYEEGDLYVSIDAGLHWDRTLEGPHLYEFGGQGSIIVAVRDSGEVGKLLYSVNSGLDWQAVAFPKDETMFVYSLTTISDATSLKFLVTGVKKTSAGSEYRILSFDFAGLHERDCKDSDFEKWSARVDKDGKATCIMGHTQTYTRRKPGADCLVNDEFHEAKPEFESCTCTDRDFECDFNFKWNEDSKKCEAAGTIPIPDGECRGKKTYKGSSGYRKIPGNDCVRAKGNQLDDPVERPCGDDKGGDGGGNAPIVSGKITATYHRFDKPYAQYYYLEKNQEGENATQVEEAVIVLTRDGYAHLSQDHGKTWKTIDNIKENIIGLYPHSYDAETMYIITSSKTVYYTLDRGKNFRSFTAPEPPSSHKSIQIMMFHPQEPDWLIWIGAKDCQTGADANCHTVAHISTNAGEEWKAMLRYVQKCQFVHGMDEKRVLCEQHAREDAAAALQLVGSSDWFVTKKTYFDDVVNFATMSEFVVLAKKSGENKKWLSVHASVNGENFAEAEFPHGFQVPHQQAYTVLDSSTHAVFMHVTTNGVRGQEYGTIIKSNSNGTSYVLSINDVNRNEDGYVDFEKIGGLEGVAIVNQVANTKDVQKGSRKQLKTKMTHNDGADWALLAPPEVDSAGNPYKCAGKGREKCSVHFHGYSERVDPRSTFGSPSAIGLVMGYGNVGEFLSEEQSETFLSRDGGVTWEAVIGGHFMWEYGDQGSVIVIVEIGKSTNRLYYTLNEGYKWEAFRFSDKDVEVTALSTVPSDNSRNFLVWGSDFAINVDFTGLTNKRCELDEDKPNSGDYYLWAPSHPNQKDDCLFGHVAWYHRKQLDALCYNGPMIHRLHNKTEICECTRKDFECDYNYERQSDGSCVLVDGLQPADPKAVCKANPKLDEYWDITGYRKIPLSTCQGGKLMDLGGLPHPCPGHEQQFNDKHSLGAVALFFVIIIPLAVAGTAGYWAWQSWGGKIGQIRLGDGVGGMGGAGGGAGGAEWTKWPVAIISGFVAVAAAIPLLAASLWRSARGAFGGGRGGGGGGWQSGGGRTYTSRSSFARGRGDYAQVDDHEGELLEDDSDEEV